MLKLDDREDPCMLVLMLYSQTDSGNPAMQSQPLLLIPGRHGILQDLHISTYP